MSNFLYSPFLKPLLQFSCLANAKDRLSLNSQPKLIPFSYPQQPNQSRQGSYERKLKNHSMKLLKAAKSHIANKALEALCDTSTLVFPKF